MTFFPPFILHHSVLLVIAIAAVALPAFDAIAKRRVSSWLVALIVFYAVSFGTYGIEEMFFREVWPSFIPMISLGLGIIIAVTHRVILAVVDRNRRR